MCVGSVCCAFGCNSALGRALGLADAQVFLPPIGGLTVYIFGNAADLRDTSKTLAFRVVRILWAPCVLLPWAELHARGRERPWASVQSGVRGLNGLHAVQHDECNGSDVFGSDICTCRPYLAHGIEGCVNVASEPSSCGKRAWFYLS